jgi:hypothetical protein
MINKNIIIQINKNIIIQINENILCYYKLYYVIINYMNLNYQLLIN